jgi:tRNA pseudouridine65 synthase
MTKAPQLSILFRDDHLVAVHKPAGLLVHRTSLDAHEKHFAVQLLRKELRRPVHPVHRLDKATSGILLFALSREVAATLSAAFERGEAVKHYVALVRGHLPEEGDIDHPLVLRYDEAEGRSPGASLEQAARTRFRRLATVELPHRVDRYPTSRYSLVQLQPLSGRRHQLRRHMSHISHHIVGDTTYGKGRHNRLFRELLGCQRMLLASVELALLHPVTRAPLTLVAPLEPTFLDVVERLGMATALPHRWL